MADQREAIITLEITPETQAFFDRLQAAKTLSGSLRREAISDWSRACSDQFSGANPKAMEEFDERWRGVLA